MTDSLPKPSTGATRRCPVCKKLNRIPPMGAAKARCGACRSPLMPASAGAASGGTSKGRSGDLSRQVIERWDAMIKLVPGGMALGRAVGRGDTNNAAADPVSWLSNAARLPRDELDQVRLLRIHLASNKVMPEGVLTRALDTLDRAKANLGPLLE